MLWENLREEEFEGAIEESKGVCVIPIGCVEAHGQHLPLGCDVMHAREYARRAAEVEPVCVFPPIYFGEKSGAGEFRGTIIFPQRLIMDILDQCCHEIARNGFKKIVILNGHGGNCNVLGTFSRSILQKKVDYMVFVYNEELQYPSRILEKKDKYPYLTKEDIEILEAYGNKKGGHGCFSETALVYDNYPELVRLDKMDKVDGVSTHLFDDFAKFGLSTPFYWMANYPNSYDGEMHYGLNERIARAMGESNIECISEMYKFIKNEKVSTEYHEKWLKRNFR